MTATWTSAGAARVADFTEAEIEDRRLEIWEGEPVEMSPAGKDHNEFADRFFLLFVEHCRTRPDLWRGGDNDGFVVSRDPDVFLCPDASLYRKRRERRGPWHRFAPEVAVEVVSPDNRRSEMLAKRRLYLAGGSEQVWIVDPDRRTFEAHFRDGRVLSAEGGRLAMEGIAAGLELDLDAIFAPPEFYSGNPEDAEDDGFDSGDSTVEGGPDR